MKTVVMTGATAGLGEVAAQHISRSPNARLIIGARTSHALREITVLPLDLARLASVRAFAEAVNDGLKGASIDALVLNAGAQFPNIDQRTEDGFRDDLRGQSSRTLSFAAPVASETRRACSRGYHDK